MLKLSVGNGNEYTRIWWEGADALESIVYDNGVDQAIGSGSIIVHKGK
jgi:hypothetical protein